LRIRSFQQTQIFPQLSPKKKKILNQTTPYIISTFLVEWSKYAECPWAKVCKQREQVKA
ncbi:hypothetical protein LINPERHAP1_LOCUS23767, partial [Linum perenne]